MNKPNFGCCYTTGSHGRGDMCGRDGYWCSSDCRKKGERQGKFFNDDNKDKKFVVILNGPPSSGKDVGVQELKKHFEWARHSEMKEHLFDMALLVSGISRELWFERYNNRKLKELPWDKLGGLTQREFLIRISEEWCKPVFGKTYFGQRAAANIAKRDSKFFFFSDGGFVDELVPINELDNVIVKIIQIHRKGCTYEGDSRSYVDGTPYGIETVKIKNNKSLDKFFEKIIEEVYAIVE